jgi:hypothetical protein
MAIYWGKQRVTRWGVSTLAALLFVLHPVSTSATSGVHVSRISHGLRLTLSVPRIDYPHNALVRVTLTLENVSHRTVMLNGNGALSVSVVDAAGHEHYAPSDPFGGTGYFTPTGGPKRPPAPLRAGHRIQTQVFLILRAATVAPYFFLAHGSLVRGRTLRFTLHDEPAPTVSISGSSNPVVSITSPVAVHGTPWIDAETACAQNSGRSITALGWIPSPPNDIVPQFMNGCDDTYPRKWHALVGWLGHPVAGFEVALSATVAAGPGLTLGTPLEPAHLTQAQAVALATAFDPEVASHPLDVAFGSWDASRLGVGASSGLIDVWKVTATGLAIPSPGPRNRVHPILDHLSIIVDDVQGKVVLSEAY